MINTPIDSLTYLIRKGTFISLSKCAYLSVYADNIK